MDADKRKKRYKQFILIACQVPFVALAIWCSIRVHHDSHERASIKEDMSEVNSIVYGLLSVDAWKDDIKKIISNQIQDFSLTPEQDSLLRIEISGVLNDLITKGKKMVEENDTTFKKKLRKIAVNFFVDWDELRKQVPEFSETIVNDLTKPKSKDRLEKLAQQKLDKFAAQTRDDTDSTKLMNILHQYDTDTREAFNKKAEQKTASLENKVYTYTFIELGILAVYLLAWIVVYRYPELRKIMFIGSVVLALTVLLVGLSSPMIEIDAHIKKIDFQLLGQHVEFNDQVLFYQTKSILQVVRILVETKKIDSILVGVMILAFSILFPITKLISTEIYLLGKDKMKKNKFVHYMAFKSGKWSMADVSVIAIFMSYVGFNSILDDQLKGLNMHTDSLKSIATNLTSLRPGYILFLSFVIFGLILSEILEKITPKKGDSRSVEV